MMKSHHVAKRILEESEEGGGGGGESLRHKLYEDTHSLHQPLPSHYIQAHTLKPAFIMDLGVLEVYI